MKKTGFALSLLLASSLAAFPALADVPASSATPAAAAQADAAAPPASAQLAAVAAQDFGRLSSDGNAAFEELSLARNAIFDGDLEGAQRLIADAQQALERARADNTAFQKAQEELMPSKAHQQPVRPAPATGPQVAWLPIDGELVLDETVQASSEKTAALEAANRHLRAGNASRASDVLRIANVDADYVVAAVPLEQARVNIKKAAQFIKTNPYKASEALRAIQNSVRYASVDIQGGNQQGGASK